MTGRKILEKFNSITSPCIMPNFNLVQVEKANTNREFLNSSERKLSIPMLLVVKSELPPHSGSLALRQMNHIYQKFFFKLSFFTF